MPKIAKSFESSGLMTLREAASYIKVHPNTLRNWEREGKISAVRLGTRKDRRFYKKILEDLCK